jgi:hypothetical protein
METEMEGRLVEMEVSLVEMEVETRLIKMEEGVGEKTLYLIYIRIKSTP